MHEGRGSQEESTGFMIRRTAIERFDRFLSMSFPQHLLLGFLIRTIFIVYGIVQDDVLNVPFTDIDYKVFSDAGRYVVAGLSPYARHTYRYSPLIAYLAVPNHYIHPTFAKYIFSSFDIMTTLLIYKILQMEGVGKCKRTYYSLFWLYNPLSIVISTRGNSDSLSALLVLLTLYFFKNKNVVYCGIAHGLSVHLRLYPVIYCLPMYLCLKDLSQGFSITELVGPTFDRVKFLVSFTLAFTSLFIFFHHLYGDEFVRQSLLFHFKRVDIRHNYSVFFYFQYLNSEMGMTVFHKAGMMSPLLVLLVCFPLYYNSEKDLSFCMLIMSFAFVTYNTVLTCQYFVWYLSLLPLVLPYIRCPSTQCMVLSSMWLLSQLSWLLPAYLLEFKFKNTFLLLWIQGSVFFLSNIVVLSALIRGYSSKVKST